MTVRQVLGVIWDVDGTLADTLGLCVSALQHSVEGVGGPRLTDDEMKAAFGPTEEGILQNLVGDRWQDAFATYLEVYRRTHDEEALVFDDVVAQVHRLAAAGVPQAVVTGKGRASADITLGSIGLEGVFDEVAAGSPEGSIKRIEIERITQQWGIPGENVVYFGDHASDVTHAQAAGVIAVSVTWAPGTDLEEIAEVSPAAVLSSGAELAAWLDGNIELLNSTDLEPT